MTSKEERRRRRNLNILFSMALTAMVLFVGTYAWFIGLSQVDVNNFEIEIKSGDGLQISLDGITFSESVAVSEAGVTNMLTTYSTNTNHWVGEDGLVPLSSTGVLSKSASRLNIYSKTSILSLEGGYKLRADLIDNHSMVNGEYIYTEQNGYVVFDLFVRNNSGTGYTEAYNNADDEGIYLTSDSFARMIASGAGNADEGGDGIENSVRVAFMQIGRLSSSATGAQVQAIKCFDEEGEQTDYTYGTSLCNAGADEDHVNGLGITFNIWEPNDTKHNAASISHFYKVCRNRTDATTYSEDHCEALVEGTAVKTYAVNDDILSSDNVNIYDGLNTYEGSTKLTEMDYFTDTEKLETDGVELFYLAPNSITKIRVYVYLEGQDVDNYDLGTVGKKVQLSFGFTKNKYSNPEDEEEGE